jgi:hypothetical protein
VGHINFDNDSEFLEITLKGVVHKLSYPTWGQVEQMEKMALNENAEQVGSMTIKFLTDMGLPEECVKDLRAHQIRKLFEELMGGNAK